MPTRQVLSKEAGMHRRAQAAFGVYSRARARRKDKGKRIESFHETRARIRSAVLLSEYQAYCADHSMIPKPINY